MCFEKHFVIEIDGSQHADFERDSARDAALMGEGFRIARYWNNDVLQRPSAVLEDISQSSPSRKNPSPVA